MREMVSKQEVIKVLQAMSAAISCDYYSTAFEDITPVDTLKYGVAEHVLSNVYKEVNKIRGVREDV